MDAQKETFKKFLVDVFQSGKKAGSKVVSRAKGRKIAALLKGTCADSDPRLKFWVKARKFSLMSYPALGLSDVLCLPAKKKDSSDTTVLSRFRRVAYVEDFYDILHRVHCQERGHVGYKKTLAEISACYECLPRSAVHKFVSLCPLCSSQKLQHNQAPLKPIIASGFMSRGQVDLIDMHHRPDGPYNWIGHYMDHWSKFHVLFALQRKSGTEVAWNLATKVFAYLGLPKILQSDNGREFTSTLINELVKNWPGDTTIVNGRPRHPQSQGLVERGNAKVEEMLACHFHENKTNHCWTDWLHEIQYKLNTCLHETTKATPYQLCFGQPPHSSPFPGATTGSVMEEAVSDILAADTCEVEEVGDISDDVEEEVTAISDSDSNAGMAGCTKEDVSATGIFEKGGSDDSDTKQNEADTVTAQCISEKEKHMSEVEDDFYASHEDMELFNHIKTEMDRLRPELIAIVKGETNSDLHNIYWHGSKIEKSKIRLHDKFGPSRSLPDHLQGRLCAHLGTITNTYKMRGYGLAYIYEVLLPEFYTRMERQEVVSSTGSASSDLAKPGDDDAVDTDSDDNEGKYCGRLGNSIKHLQARIKADKHYRSNAERMKNRYLHCTNVTQFEVGNLVSVRIPKIDRARTDIRRLPCIVVQKTGKKHIFYRLRCVHGVLKSCYQESDLELYPSGDSSSNDSSLKVDGWKEENRITLREASMRQNPCNKFYGDKCSCKKGCSSRRCGCVMKGKPCSSHCHGGRPCQNEGEHVTPRKSPSCIANGEESGCNDEEEHVSVDGSPSSSRNGEESGCKDEEEHVSPSNGEYCSCKKGCSSRRCGCVRKANTCSSHCHGGRTCKNEGEHITPRGPSMNTTTWLSELSLNVDDKNTICSGGWLTDRHISAASELLKSQFPQCKGLDNPILGENFSFPILKGEGVQILHVDEIHWICISTMGCNLDEVNLYDSRFTTVSPATIKLICSLLHCCKSELTVNIMQFQLQSNGSDCGVYAIACATSLCNGDEPADQCWNQKKMRPHLLQCLENTYMSAYPVFSAEEAKSHRKKILNSIKVPVYCTCRLPWHKEDMIQCEACMEWYHPNCLSLPDHIFKSAAPWRCSTCFHDISC